MDGANGPGVRFCRGKAGNGAPIKTDVPGPHKFKVTARSKDGQTVSVTASYSVVLAPGGPNVKLTIAYGKSRTQHLIGTLPVISSNSNGTACFLAVRDHTKHSCKTGGVLTMYVQPSNNLINALTQSIRKNLGVTASSSTLALYFDNRGEIGTLTLSLGQAFVTSVEFANARLKSTIAYSSVHDTSC